LLSALDSSDSLSSKASFSAIACNISSPWR
jgi:hypothetical protein